VNEPDQAFELFALRYGSMNRTPRDNFLRANPKRDQTTMDYFVWVARRADRVIVIDTGFRAAGSAGRSRSALHSVAEGLAQLDIAGSEVSDVVLTHLHNDHAGGTELFPEATFHVQSRELSYATGPALRHPMLGRGYDIEDLTAVMRLVAGRRVRCWDGRAEVAVGITGHLVGGHTAGSQAVVVATARGPVLLASDTVHYYANFIDRNPFPSVVNMVELLDGYDEFGRLAAAPAALVPGHDPLVLDLYPAPADELTGWIARLDVDPVAVPLG
jgi:glyoxylase-like metal-dependent hydrolase (beta-lactamase superfamily II)